MKASEFYQVENAIVLLTKFLCFVDDLFTTFPYTTSLLKAKKLKGWLGMMCLGDGIVRSMDFPEEKPTYSGENCPCMREKRP